MWDRLERFSFECRKVIGFAFITLRDWLKKLAPLFHPIRSKIKTNRDSPVRVFPRFASATCNYFVFWLVHLIICVLFDCLEFYSGFGFTTLKWKPLSCSSGCHVSIAGERKVVGCRWLVYQVLFRILWKLKQWVSKHQVSLRNAVPNFLYYYSKYGLVNSLFHLLACLIESRIIKSYYSKDMVINIFM